MNRIRPSEPQNHVDFCQRQRAETLAALDVEESYPAFAVVELTAEQATELRQRFPVEELKPPPLTARTTPKRDASKGDLLVRFGQPVRKAWLKKLEKAGAKVQQAFGASAVIARCRTKKAFEAVRELPSVVQVDPHVPEIQMSPEFFKGLGVAATDKSIAKATVRLANGEIPKASRRSLSCSLEMNGPGLCSSVQ